MSKLAHTLVLAVDGGGTRCRVAALQDGAVLTAETGSANVSTDFDGAIRQVKQGVEALASRAGCAVSSLYDAPAYVGLAGVTGPRIAGRIRDSLPFRRVRVEDDRVAAVRGVLGQRDGAIGHCGTGSFCGAQSGGEIRLAGGWGPVLGDEASAHWVGRQALAMTLQAIDGCCMPSSLSTRLAADFEGGAGIVDFAGSARPSEIGSLAPLVTEYAGRGDAIASEILRRGAQKVSGCLRAVGWTPGQVVCLTGGIGPQFIPFLPQDLRSSVADPVGKPLDGALSLAQEFAREIAQELIQGFSQDFAQETADERS